MTALKTIVIEAGGIDRHYWRDLWRYRELLVFLTWRDLLIRYKQTILGLAWSWLKPLITMFVFTVVFGKLANLPSGDVPYPIMVFAGLLPWLFFSNTVAETSNSLVANAHLISKVYFPRLIIPFASIAVGIVDMLISSVLLVALMAWFGHWPNWQVITLPFFLLMAAMTSAGVGLWLAALNVKYRDIRYIVPFALQLGMYISPVGFSSAVIPEKWQLIFFLNPMSSVIEGFRWALLGGGSQLYVYGLLWSLTFSIFLLLTGVIYFRKTEKTFADVI